MYFCGPTVYQRAHIGNARAVRARDVAARLARAPRLRGDARPQHHRHQRQDLRRRAGRERGARRATRRGGTSRTRDRPRPRHARRRCRQATEAIPSIVAFIEKLVERGHAYEVEGDVYFRVATRSPTTAASRGSGSTTWRRGAESAQGGSARLRALEGEQAGRGHVVGLAVGRGRPGWHIECSVMAEEHSAPSSRSTAAASTSSSRTTRTSSRSRVALGHDFARIWMHNGMLSMRGGEKMSQVARQRRLAPRRHRPLGPRGRAAASSSRATGASRSTSPRRRSSRRARSSRRSATSSARRASRSGTGPRSRRRSTTTSTRRRRSPCCTAGATTSCCGARSGSSASSRSPRRRRRRPSSPRSPSGGATRARRRTSPEADRLRDEIEAAGWEVRDVAEPPGFRLVRRS